LSSRQLSSLDTALSFEALEEFYISELAVSSVNITLNSLEVSLLLLLLLNLFKNIDFLVELLLTDDLNDLVLVLIHLGE